MYFLRWDQISHRRFERLVPHPVLYGADIETGPVVSINRARLSACAFAIFKVS